MVKYVFGNVLRLQKFLLQNPYRGNIILGGGIMVAADIAIQQIFKTKKVDWKRTAVMASWASMVVVPTRYRVIQLWDRVLSGKYAFFKGLATNQTLTCTLLPTFMIFSSSLHGALNGKRPNFEEINDKIRDNFKTSWVAMTCFWTPFHSFNFFLVPPVWRVITASCGQFFSGCFLSMMQFGQLDVLLQKFHHSRHQFHSSPSPVDGLARCQNNFSSVESSGQ